MTARKPKKRAGKAISKISVPSSAGVLTVPYMNFYAEQISAIDMKKLWQGLQGGVRVADRGTTSAMAVNGIIFAGGLQGDVTVSITPSGFVLIFTNAKPVSPSTTERGR